MPAKLTCIVPSHTTLQLLCLSGQSSRDALPFVLSELHLSKVNEHKGSGLTISRRNSFSLCKKMLLDLHAGASFRGNAERPVSPVCEMPCAVPGAPAAFTGEAEFRDLTQEDTG